MHSGLFQSRTASSGEGHWLSVTDLMAGLMVIFLLISVALMNRTDIDKRAIERIAVKISEKQLEIHRALAEEFEEDFKRWEIDFNEQRPLIIDFNAERYKFTKGKSVLPEQLTFVLGEFFPRYLNVLERYRNEIKAIQIEGHTSSGWNNDDSEFNAYYKNMNLSQNRSKQLFDHIMSQGEPLQKHLYWLRSKLSAIGYGPSKLILTESGDEDKERSRRISFRIIADSDIIMKDILEAQ
ncbi:OmpA family protein [Vibrio aestuarianus]|uniref:OmpA family protein n=1 Tax=Vibrio aestuarianus TaxID=28171 RepID=UPI001559E5E0|nr:OmpA family protein [Vibrio aestuarianus]NGZ14501.1 OmpA family protein [Vibrio aestuarianus]NKZ50649.1 OmpA family protein [Vibrio aestuarianus]